MALIDGTYTVEKGDCAWKAARKSLQSSGKTVTNSEIMKEMSRLAKLNGCETVDDFNQKFFSRIGLSFTTGDTAQQPEEPKQETPKIPDIPADSSRSQCVTVPTDNIQVKTPAVPAPIKPTVAKPKTEVEKINEMESDEQRIVEYNKNHYNGEYYGIVDKKSCQLKIYDKDGNVVRTFTVGVGKLKGDDLCSYYLERAYKTDKQDLAEQGRYTTAGEFTLDEYTNYNYSNYISQIDGKHKIMDLKGDNKGERSGNMAIHMVPNYCREQREAWLDSETTSDNRMSYGCVNLKESDYDEMHAYLGEGDKLYVLPEEEGNKLQLEKQSNGTYKFEQQYHKLDKRSVSKEVASMVRYDVRPDRNPTYIAEQKRKKAEEERLLAQQRAQQEKQNSLVWYNPFTWFA